MSIPGLPPGTDLFQLPSKQPPDGVIPEFHRRSPLLDFTIAVSAIFLPLMYIFLGIRLWMRMKQRQRWMLDDSIVVTTAICCTVFSGLILANVQKLAKHSWDVPLGDVISAETQKTMVSQHVFNTVSLWLGKFCILAMYYRIFGHIQKVKWQLYGVALLTLPIFVSIILQPTLVGPPIGKPWGTPNPLVEETKIPGLMVGIDNFLVDLLIAYIPIPLINGLNLSRRKKNGIIILFATGFIAVISDIVTLYFRVRLYQQVDQLLYGYITHNCALIDGTISVILSSLPSSAKLWHVTIEPSNFYQSLRSRLVSSRGSRGSGGSRSGRTTNHELPVSMDAVPARKKRDPYSIGMPTTNLSQTHLNKEDGLELTQTKHGVVKSQVTSEHPDERHAPGDIYRKVSVEQSSISYPDSQKSSKQRDIF